MYLLCLLVLLLLSFSFTTSLLLVLVLYMKHFQKQPSRGDLRKRCSENMHQVSRRTLIAKCNFTKVAKHGCSLVHFLHVFRTPFPRNTSGRLLLQFDHFEQRLQSCLVSYFILKIVLALLV